MVIKRRRIRRRNRYFVNILYKMGKTFRKKNRGKKAKSRTRKYKRSMKHRGGGGSMSKAMPTAPRDPELAHAIHGVTTEGAAIDAELTAAENRIRELYKKQNVTRAVAAAANAQLDAAVAAAGEYGYRKSTMGHYAGPLID
jgi:hypothetical protein